MELKLSQLSENQEDAIVTLWHVMENAGVSKGQGLLEVSTDKATFDIDAPCDGVVTRILKNVGDKVSADEVIAEIT